jgi:hypothetical protein
MAKISKTFEKLVKSKNGSLQNQFLVLSVDCDKDGDFDSYDDVTVDLIINDKLIAEISGLLDKAGLLIDLIDSINWRELSQAQNED